MKESIFRVLSLVIGLGGLASISTTYVSLFSLSNFDLANIVAGLIFILFAIGGSRLLSKLPLTPFLNDKVGSIFTTGRETVR